MLLLLLLFVALRGVELFALLGLDLNSSKPEKLGLEVKFEKVVVWDEVLLQLLDVENESVFPEWLLKDWLLVTLLL